FFCCGSCTHRYLHSFPTRRSSDLFRLPQADALINRMGFNNGGVDAFIRNVQASRWKAVGGVLGLNIGKNADTPIERAADDYLYRSEEHTSELQSRRDLVCRLLLEK